VKVQIKNQQEQKINLLKLKEIMLTVMKLMQIRKESEVSLLFTNDKGIKELNRFYRKIDKPTDVLSFNLLDKNELYKVFDNNNVDEYEEILLGDIVISVETAKAQSEKYGQSLYQELTILMIHGLLHLLGYDHFKGKEAEEMKEEEHRLLSYIKQKEMI